MSVDRSVRANNSSRRVGVGSFGNAPSIVVDNEFDAQTRARLNGEPTYDDSSPLFKDWSPAKQRAAYEGISIADESRAIKTQSADEFLSLHAEFIDNGKNGDLMNKMLKNLYGDIAYTPEHFEAAYQSLRVSNALDIDSAEVAKQQQAAATARRKTAIKGVTDAAARAFNQDADYDNVSLEDLRARANEEMQRRGEEGGC